jgi:asparagine synthase (glutamine-hydrolysing)
VFLDEEMLIDFLPEMVWHQDEPNGDPVCVPLYYVSKLARDSGTVVVQVGEGSDEEFSGYSNYLREVRYHKYYYAGLPGIVQKLAYPLFKTLTPDSILVDYARRAVEKDVPFYGGAKGVTQEVKKNLLSESFYAASEPSSRVVREHRAEFERMVNGSSESDYLRHMMYLEFKNRLVELLLMRVDKMSMAVSVEARVPFLDHRLVEFAFRIPQELKIKDGIPKYILKKACEGIIPNEIIYRKKQGFNAPIEEWLRTGRLAPYVRDRIMSSGLMRLDIFRKEYIDYMFTQHKAHKANYSTQLWGIMLACMWYDRFIERSAGVS